MTATTYIMAAFNAEETLRQAVESIFSQTIKDWELIIVDDASTDRTAAIASEYNEDPRVMLLSNDQNMGAAWSRNRAIDRSTSDLVGVMDSDDVSLPHRLEATLQMFQSDQDLVVASGQVQEFGDWGESTRTYWPTTQEGISRRMQRRLVPVPHPSSTFRRAAVQSVGGYDEACRRSEDYALYLRLKHATMACDRRIFVRYRTQRPISLRYAIQSGRYSHLARTRNAAELSASRDKSIPLSLPRSAAIDAYSTGQWLKRRWNER